LFAAVVAPFLVTGCQSGKLSSYISPRVTGRVLAADTQPPLSKTTVRRTVPMPSASPARNATRSFIGGVRVNPPKSAGNDASAS
jgi:hypothetical protein